MADIQFTIQGETPSKKNKWHISKHGGMYLDKSVKDWNDEVAWHLKNLIREHGIITQNIVISVHFFIRRDKDVDNLLSSIFDALQYAGLIQNDKQIIGVMGWKELSKKEEPRAKVEITFINNDTK